MVVNLASTGSNARCYIVNGGGQTVPDWLAPRKKADRRRRNKSDTANAQGLRLIQDFEFPEASNKIKTTRDGQYCLATGTYKPRLRIYDLLELGLKSERVTDAENVDFVILSDDWTKTLHLQTDRSISVHTASSVFYSTRIPTHGRALAYHFPSCDALVGATGRHIYRLNLDQGRFLNPLECNESVEGVNAIDVNPAHGLLACGTENDGQAGTVEFWDPRSRRRAGILELPASQLQGSTSFFAGTGVAGSDVAPLSVSALASRMDGLNIAVGTSTGHTLLYDLRNNSPYTIKDQGYGLPIKKIEWCYSSGSSDSNEAAGLVASVDAKVLKIWGSQSSSNLISINPPHNINDLHIFPGSGLVMLANEASPITAYYIPSLGQAPKWSRFLDNMTEEMEQDSVETMYDDYKFVDRAELRQLGMDHLIGTNTLKPYMHGFFVDLRLYTKARAIANPFAYAEHRDRLLREKLEKERESRIRTSKAAIALSKRAKEGEAAVQKASVNRELAEKIRQREEKEDKLAAKREARKAAAAAAAKKTKNATASDGSDEEVEEEEDDSETEAAESSGKRDGPASILTDSRFGALFQDPDFQVDQDSLEFAMLNPSTVSQRNAKPKDRQAIVEDDDQDEEEEEQDDEDASSDDDDVASGNSSDEGDLGQYDPRVNSLRLPPGQVDARTGKRKAPNQVRERDAQREKWAASKEAANRRHAATTDQQSGAVPNRPRLVVDGDESSVSYADRAMQTFGQRAAASTNGAVSTSESRRGGGNSSRSGRSHPRGSSVPGSGSGSGSAGDGGLLRSTGGGGMEYTFTPTTTDADDRDDGNSSQQSKKQRMDKQARDNIAKSRFGAGLEKGSSASDSARAQLDLSEADRSGRTKMRRGIRSASRNVTRNL